MARIAVIGCGFFGLYLADFLAQRGHAVSVFEKEMESMSHASYNNQARVHNGYHYPRSVLTAFRSRVSFPRFVQEFPEAVYRDFEQYYLVGRKLSKVTAYQFASFCKRIGAPVERASDSFRKLINDHYIEDCFKVHEYAFDAKILKQHMLERISNLPINISYNTEIKHVRWGGHGDKHHIYLDAIIPNHPVVSTGPFDHVFNCTYSRLNYLLSGSGLDLIPLKHELTELCLVCVPEPLQHVGITVMCGPFFSVMPFPSVRTTDGLPVHSFSHVRYTPHYEWYEQDSCPVDPYRKLKDDPKHTAWPYIRRDAARYLPILADTQYRSSLWEVKTVLPRSESDDSRPILFRTNVGLKGLHCVMGGKIDNVYDVLSAVERELQL